MEQRKRIGSAAESDDEAGPPGKRSHESGDDLRSERPGVGLAHVKRWIQPQYGFRRSPVRSSTREAISSIDAALVSRHGIR